MNNYFQVFASQDAVFAAAARFFRDRAARAVRDCGFFTVALSGGAAPDGLFSLLATEYREQIAWEKGHFFWVDERCVPPASEFSNYGRAAGLLLTHLPVKPENIHRIEAETSTAATDYDRLLRDYQPLRRTDGGIPVFDVMQLGLGEDGHTASLFPGAAALNETARLAVTTPAPATARPAVPRATLTLPVLNAAANLFFLVADRRKFELAEFVARAGSPVKYPAQLVRPSAVPAAWFVHGFTNNWSENESNQI